MSDVDDELSTMIGDVKFTDELSRRTMESFKKLPPELLASVRTIDRALFTELVRVLLSVGEEVTLFRVEDEHGLVLDRKMRSL